MSGSSLDGIDLALCTFDFDPEQELPVRGWSIAASATVSYPVDWRTRLGEATSLSAPDLLALDAELGEWIGRRAADFLEGHERPLLAGCHGHTVYHAPDRGFTLQIGHGARIAAHLGVPTLTDLRSADIAAGGEGAPLAPVADRHLFPDYRGFLNLGGIANFSFRRKDGDLAAGDISGCCQVLDRLAQLAGRPYDANGSLARSGSLLPDLMQQLDALPYHDQPCPKSLSNQWVTDTLWPVLRDHPGSVADRLCTFCTWLGAAVGGELERQYTAGGYAGAVEILVSGGGTHNAFLLERLQASQPGGGALTFRAAPGPATDFKEAALVALCALLRHFGLPNSLASATGARHDTLNGALYAA